MIKHFCGFTTLVACLILYGCSSYSGNWPSLSDPIPGASENTNGEVRAHESAAPSTPVEPIGMETETPLTVSTAIKQLTAIRADLAKADTTYQSARSAIATAAPAEDKEIAWREAQLMLTRLSTTLNKLDAIIYSAQLKGKPVRDNAATLYSEQEAYIADERQKLASMKP
ncbi:hypothetical protein [Kordiimonas pumila]|uniref:DUF4398 domain-containing protein n=1 Tax=Kordiimonas pumila TaxID=2161677 RepID=A0ABV7D564_9PROT|nr:hypothetical protein [Kordiimonas pumila]